MADQVLHMGVRGVTDLMVMPGLINLDFADIRTVMSEMGKAMMGTGEAEGENRAIEAAEAAISNPLLDDVSMKGARGVLINITGGLDMTLFEVDAAANRIREEVDPDANIIFGSTFDESLEGRMRVSVVADRHRGAAAGAAEAAGHQPGQQQPTAAPDRPADFLAGGDGDSDGQRDGVAADGARRHRAPASARAAAGRPAADGSPRSRPAAGAAAGLRSAPGGGAGSQHRGFRSGRARPGPGASGKGRGPLRPTAAGRCQNRSSAAGHASESDERSGAGQRRPSPSQAACWTSILEIVANSSRRPARAQEPVIARGTPERVAAHTGSARSVAAAAGAGPPGAAEG